MAHDDDTRRPQPTVAPHETAIREVPVELAGMVGTSRRVPDANGRAADSMLAVYGERMTYTFICGDEVASIHFDQTRGEIFFRGHNIQFMDLDSQQLQGLLALEEILAGDREGRAFFSGYHATLARLLTDKHK